MTAVADPGVVAGGRPRSGLLIAGWAAVLGTVLSFARTPLTGELDLPETTASPEAIVGFFRGSNFDAALATGVFAASHTGLGADGYVLLHGMNWSLIWLDSILFALWLLPLGIAIVITRLFPRWLGWALVATGVGGVVAFFIPNDVLVNVFGGLPYLWILIAGVLMLLRTERYSQL